MVNAKWVAQIGLSILLVSLGCLSDAHAHEQQNAQRIITAGGSLTEIVFALELLSPVKHRRRASPTTHFVARCQCHGPQ